MWGFKSPLAHSMEFADTGLPGVPEFHAAASSALDEGLDLVVLAVDVAEVVTANVGHGWAAGNALIEQQAVRLRSMLGDRPLFHLGGDLFAALLLGSSSSGDGGDLLLLGWQLSSAIEERLAEPIPYGHVELPTAATCWAIKHRAGEPAAVLFGHIASLEAKGWGAVHRQAREVFASARSFAELAQRIAAAGVERLQMRAMRVSIRGEVAEVGDIPDRPADGRSPTSSADVSVEWWVREGGSPELGSVDEPIAAAIDAQVELLAAVAAERDVGDRDPLTGLLNRRGFSRGLEKLAGPWTLVLADVDRLKQINDTYGHEAGDTALRRVADLLLEGRAGDLVGRWGGEEFIVALRGTDPDGASAWLGRLIERGRTADDDRERVTFSAGVVAWPSGEPLEDAVARADVALYAAKDAGRATVVVA